MRWTRYDRAPRLGLGLALLVVLLGVAFAQEPQAPQAPASPAPPAGTTPPPTWAGPDTCAPCHQEVLDAFRQTPHGRTSVETWDGAAACESCHGNGTAHAEEGDATKIANPSKLPAPDANAVCQTCHDRGEHARWQGSAHESRNLSCLTCHKVHHEGAAPPGLLAKATEFDTCGSCHLKRKAVLLRSSHMPLREGRMSCGSCHDPHGGPGPGMLIQDSVNENCYACHAEKRSPLLWEHPPVKENCLNCHDAHGTLHPRMQIAKQPRLCQQCHDEARHPTQPYSDAASGEEFFPNSRMFDRGCMNCHSQVHGSNHPAGQRFMR